MADGEGFKIADAYVSVHAVSDKDSARKASQEVVDDIDAEIEKSAPVVAPKTNRKKSKDTGKEIGFDIGDGLVSQRSQIGNVIQNLLSPAATSAMAKRLGVSISDHIANGVQDNAPRFHKALGDIALTQARSAMAPLARDLGKSIVDNTAGGIEQNRSRFGQSLENLGRSVSATAVVNAMPSIGDAIAAKLDTDLANRQNHVSATLRKLIAADEADTVGADFGRRVGRGIGNGIDTEIKRRRFRLPNVDMSGALQSIKRFGDSSDVAERRFMQFGRTLTIIGAINVFGSLITGAGGLVAALVPILGILAAIPAAAATAAAGISTLFAGLSGVGSAFKAFGKTPAGGGGGGGGGGAKVDNTRNLQRAVESAARGVKSAEKEVERAFRDVAEAAQDTQRAQENLSRARREATRTLADYQDRLTGAKIDEERASLALRDAERDLQNLRDWGIEGTDQYRSAELDVIEAELRLKDAREANVELQIEANEALAKGVDGAEEVKDATDDLNQAHQAEVEAKERVVEAQQNVILANQQLADAQEDLNKKIDGGGAAGGGVGAVNAYNEALAKLAPNARAFVLAVVALKGRWDELTRAVQQRLFEGFATEITKLANVGLPTLQTGMVAVAGSWNAMGINIMQAMQTPLFQGAMATVFAETAKSIKAFADASGPLTLGLANLSAVGAPFITRFSEWAAKGLANAGAFLSSAEGAEKVRSVLDRASIALKAVWDIAVNLGKALFNMLKAFDGAGFLQTIVKITDQFAKWTASAEGQRQLAEIFRFLGEAVKAVVGVVTVLWDVFSQFISFLDQHPAIEKLILNMLAWALVIGPVISGIVGIVLGIAGFISAVSAIGAALTWVAGIFGLSVAGLFSFLIPIALVVAAVVALAAIIYLNFDTIKNAIGVAWDWVSQKTSQVWDWISQKFSSAWQAIQGAASSGANWVKQRIEDLSSIPGRVGDFFERVRASIANKFGEAVSFVRGIPGQIIGALGNVGGMLYDSGTRIIQGLIDGIKNMAGRVKDAIASVLGMARNLLPFSPAKEGPFSGKGWTLYSGQSMVEALAEGVKSRGSMLADATANVLGGAASGFELAPSYATAGAAAMTGSSTSNSRSISIGQLVLQVSGSLDMTSETDKRRFLTQVRDGLVNLEQETA